MAAEDAETLLERWKKQFNLSEIQIEYLRGDAENACDASDAAEEIKAMEKDIKEQDYVLASKLGAGAFGNVYKGRRKRDDKIVAIKVIDLEETKDDIENIRREITALVDAKSCPQLISYYGSSVYGTKLWIAMEYVDGGSVLEQVKTHPFDEKQCATVAREVLLGLQYLAMEGKIHRDIKAANILLSGEGKVKLADFGATGQLTDTVKKCSTFVGSPYWMAPEILTQKQYDGKADIWSLGITCLEMVNGRPPHAEKPPVQVMMIIPKNPPPVPDRARLAKNFCDFVSICLTKDPVERPDIKTLLKHPFIVEASPTLTVSARGASSSSSGAGAGAGAGAGGTVIGSHASDAGTVRGPAAERKSP